MAGVGNETRSSFWCAEMSRGAGDDAQVASQNIMSGKLKSARQGRIEGADRMRAAPIALPWVRGAASNPTGRSANGSQAGTAEHYGFLPEHGTNGTAAAYDLCGQRQEAHWTD